MSKTLFLLTLTLCLSSLPAGAQSSFEIAPPTDRLIRMGLNAMYGYDLTLADKTFDEIVRRFPQHPAGHVYKAELVWWKALRNRKDPRLQAAFEQYTDQAIAKGEMLLRRNREDFYALLYLASAYGNRGRFYVTVTESYFGALRAGLKGDSYNRAAYALRPNHVDCLIGLGSYNYFTGSLPAVIKPFAWLIGARGDKDTGLSQLETAAARGEFGQVEAKLVLLGAYINERRFDEYRGLLAGLMEQHPANPIFPMWLADFYIKEKRIEEGIRVFSDLLKTQSAGRDFLAAELGRLTRARNGSG